MIWHTTSIECAHKNEHFCPACRPHRLTKAEMTQGQYTIHVRYLSATTPYPEWAHDKIMKGLGL